MTTFLILGLNLNLIPDLEVFTEKSLPCLAVFRDFSGSSFDQDFTLIDDVGGVGDFQGVAHVVVGNDNPDPLFF